METESYTTDAHIPGLYEALLQSQNIESTMTANGLNTKLPYVHTYIDTTIEVVFHHIQQCAMLIIHVLTHVRKYKILSKVCRVSDISCIAHTCACTFRSWTQAWHDVRGGLVGAHVYGDFDVNTVRTNLGHTQSGRSLVLSSCDH